MARHEDGNLKYESFGRDEVLECRWLKALKLEEYASRRPRRKQALQGVLFSYPDALSSLP